MYAEGVRRLKVIVVAALLAACGSTSRDLLVRGFDAGSDGGGDAARDATPVDAGLDGDLTVGGPCVDDPQCDDKVPCTFDACDQAIHRCRNTPDDTRCEDGVFCNGREKCLLGRGCAVGPAITCQDGLACTIDRCDEPTRSCEHAPRDADGDSDPDDHCPPGTDCNDADPAVSGKHSEVCGNHKDDNCNGVIDELPCATAQHDTCQSALAVTASGTYALSTLGAQKTFAATCSVTTPLFAHDVVASITIPAGGPQDLDVGATTTGTEVSVALFSSCGQPATELACAASPGAPSARARARSLGAGTYFAVVTTALEAPVELKVDLLPPTAKATNETCASAAPIAVDVPFTASLIDPSRDLPSVCPATTGELTYALTLAQAQDVRVFASTLAGSGQPVVGLRAPHCTDAADELRCRTSGALPLFARSLPAGTYVITVAATSTIDVSVVVKTYPPTSAPADQTCATAPPATVNATELLSLGNHEDAIKDGCSAGNPNAARALVLTVPSDVMVVGRFPQNEAGAVSLDGPTCDVAAVRACAQGTTPVRISKRNVPPGDYRIVVGDSLAENDTLTTLVRPTVPPTLLGTGSNGCAAAATAIPAAGGFFSGDTTGLAATLDESCDAPSSPGGAPEQVLRLDLTQPRRVVFNMDGSTYNTILSIRQGATCPGQELAGACYAGFSGPRSFLDLTLVPGTYWVIVDGYAGAAGPWNLDVRTLTP